MVGWSDGRADKLSMASPGRFMNSRRGPQEFISAQETRAFELLYESEIGARSAAALELYGKTTIRKKAYYGEA